MRPIGRRLAGKFFNPVYPQKGIQNPAFHSTHGISASLKASPAESPTYDATQETQGLKQIERRKKRRRKESFARRCRCPGRSTTKKVQLFEMALLALAFDHSIKLKGNFLNFLKLLV